MATIPPDRGRWAVQCIISINQKFSTMKKPYCRLRLDLFLEEVSTTIGNDELTTMEPLRYRWLNDTEGFQVYYKKQWQNAESIDFEFFND